eukprot:CAMPEP_0117675556 /NCGR_PEP_ID=MMETSP0804-20121206/15673_1 /TAXON_ID=1074897 /ORGANISM="Tetraselmis astigmatica, Strain CCMP880" /LENGTH=75 /DNA_ID=CAMNT_0005484577 /DNA_START=134 /DNA_END=361 /DNA_ORIENTATION=+
MTVHPSAFYAKVVAGSFLVGAGMEFFMLKTGFYDVVTRVESENLQSTMEEKEHFLQKLKDHHEQLKVQRSQPSNQ